MTTPNEVTDDEVNAAIASYYDGNQPDTRKAMRTALADFLQSRSATSDAAIALPVQTTSNAQDLQDGFRAGWAVAAAWAIRDDLLADIGSPAYLKDMAKALSTNIALPVEPALQPLTDVEILAIAHRKASTYTHRDDGGSPVYGFKNHTMLDFARAMLAAHIKQRIDMSKPSKRIRAGRKQMWCANCKTATHDTEKCWGLGTVSVVSRPEPIHRLSNELAEWLWKGPMP